MLPGISRHGPVLPEGWAGSRSHLR
jgi:hypothetical protein